jgi:hypothetical protein
MMKGYWAGLLTGLLIGGGAGASIGVATAAVCAGTGYAMGWTVTKDGNDLCDDPYIWSGTHEIECD